MTAPTQERSYRIGTVAARLGVTTRTIRYYEELGLLGSSAQRCKGAHRLYSEADVTRLQEVLRLRDLLGLSLEAIVDLARAEEARAALRDEWDDDPSDADRMRIIETATPLIERQLALVQERQRTLSSFAKELKDRLKQVEEKRAELEAKTSA